MADRPVVVAFYPTSEFVAHYGPNRLDRERDWFVNQVWGEINHPVDTVVVNVRINLTKNNIPDRARQVDEQVASEDPSYTQYDCIVALDYYGNDSNYVGFTPDIGSAGTPGVAYVDFASPALFPADDLAKPHRRYIGHEVGHVFGCYHSDGAVFSSDEVTYMWNGGKGRCFDSGSSSSTVRQYASCGENTVNQTANRISGSR